jgi:hypothetical protein
MNLRRSYLLMKTLPFAGIPITLLVALLDTSAANILMGLTFGALIGGNIYASYSAARIAGGELVRTAEPL